jgi:hypothetical protein
MSRLRCILVVLAALVLSLSFAAPVEDDPQTPYDEAESLPYEMTATLSGDGVQQSAPTLQVVPIALSDSFSAPRRASGRAGCRELAAHHRSNSLIILDHTLRC